MSHDRGCHCGKEPYEYEECQVATCGRRRNPLHSEAASLNRDEPPPEHAVVPDSWYNQGQPGVDRFGYLSQLHRVAQAGNQLITAKTATYKDSWKARGGRGAWYTLVRPLDRLQSMVEDRHQGDIFAAIEANPEGGDGTALDALRDLRNYLNLVEAEMVARGVVKL